MNASELKELLPLTRVASLYNIPITIGHGRQPCPFCHSKTAFATTREKYYRCYKCGKSGDIYKLIQDNNQATSFVDAYKRLLSHVQGSHLHSTYIANLSGLNQAFSLYKDEASKNESIVKSYVESRGWTYKPGHVGLARPDTLTKGGMTIEELTDLQLYNPDYKTEHFTNHLVFPVRDLNGNIVHFTARALDKDAELRWKHSKGKSPINNFLYNSNTIKSAERVIICEGASDCESLKEMGESAVGVFGVNIPLVHNAQVFTNCKSVLAVFDRDKYPLGDEQAGQYKSWTHITPHLIDLAVEIKKPIFCLMVPNLPGVKDVNDYLLEIEYDKVEFQSWLRLKQPLHKIALDLYKKNIKKHDLLWRLQAACPINSFDRYMQSYIEENYNSWPEYLRALHA
jgi:DNA primase